MCSRRYPLSMFSLFLVFQGHVSHSCLIFAHLLENFGHPCSTSSSHCPLTVRVQRLQFLHDPAPTFMPHIAARWRALRPATKPYLAIDLRAAEHHARVPMSRPLACCYALRPRAHSKIVLRVVVYIAHAHCCVHCPGLFAPMPQRALFCRALANSPVPPCFCAHHKHAHLLPWLGTRPPSQATAVGLHDSRW